MVRERRYLGVEVHLLKNRVDLESICLGFTFETRSRVDLSLSYFHRRTTVGLLEWRIPLFFSHSKNQESSEHPPRYPSWSAFSISLLIPYVRLIQSSFVPGGMRSLLGISYHQLSKLQWSKHTMPPAKFPEFTPTAITFFPIFSYFWSHEALTGITYVARELDQKLGRASLDSSPGTSHKICQNLFLYSPYFIVDQRNKKSKKKKKKTKWRDELSFLFALSQELDTFRAEVIVFSSWNQSNRPIPPGGGGWFDVCMWCVRVDISCWFISGISDFAVGK